MSPVGVGESSKGNENIVIYIIEELQSLVDQAVGDERCHIQHKATSHLRPKGRLMAMKNWSSTWKYARGQPVELRSSRLYTQEKSQE